MEKRVFTQPLTASPQTSWWFLSDLCNDVIWRQEIKEVHLVSGTPRLPDATYREVVQWQQFRAETLLSVVESAESKRLVIASEGTAYRSRSLWTFEPFGDGSLLTLVFSMEAAGAMHLAEGLITDMVSRWLERDLPRLQGHLQTP